MAKGYGIETSSKETTAVAWLVGAAVAGLYLWGNKVLNLGKDATKAATSWGSDIGGAFNFGSGDNWVNKAFDTAGDWLGDVGEAIDFSDQSKWNWLSGGGGILDTTGDFLDEAADVGGDLISGAEQKVESFLGWLNPWD